MSSKKESKKEEVLEEELIEENIEETDAAEANVEDALTEVQAEVDKLKELLLRERAEVENFKRRTRSDVETTLKYASQSLITELLPVLDSFDRALATEEAEGANAGFVKGFEMIYNQLFSALAKEGLEIIPIDGEFDPHMHQAIMQENHPDKENNIILEELQRGYRLKDRVLRASMVKVNIKE